jgi:hypothetical protein
MVNAKDDIKSDKLSNIGHTITLIREAAEVANSSQLHSVDKNRVKAAIAVLTIDLKNQSKALRRG